MPSGYDLLQGGGGVNGVSGTLNLPADMTSGARELDMSELLTEEALELIRSEHPEGPMRGLLVKLGDAPNLRLSNVDVEINDRHRGSLLHVACRLKLIRAASKLIEGGANLEFLDYYGRTPLHVAVEQLDLQMARLLIMSGANVNAATDAGGYTPLNLMCRNPNHGDPDETPLLKMLLENNADVNRVDADGKTPLINACENNNTDIVRILLEKNADVDKPGADGRTPLDVAASEGNRGIIRLLRESKEGADMEF